MNVVKKIGEVAGKAVVILFFFGLLFFPVMLFGMLGAFPLYMTKALGVIGILVYLAILASWSRLLSAGARRWMWRGLLAAVVCAGMYVGAGAYQDSLPALDDRERDRMLWEYEPFSEDSKAVTLPEEASLKLDLPHPYALKVDGATALYPVYAGFVQAVFPEGEYRRYEATSDGYGAVTCSGTTEAYERLLTKKTDVIFVAGPSDDQLARAEELGMELHMTPIGREAFVFFVHSKNPVDGLTVEQIQGIYSGEITSWKEVGGRSQKIRPFQRDENSGSQTSLQRLMGDIPILEPEEEDRVSGMGGIIRQVASYRNYKNALGFSFRYYSTEMVADGDIKLLALNGVEPTKDTIRDGSYPVASSFYAVTAAPIGEPAPEETNDNLAAFLNWILSEEGQWVIEETGYVGIR